MQDLQLFLEINKLPYSLKSKVLEYVKSLSTPSKSKIVKARAHPKAGCMKGTFKLSPDFDAPLEDFKEYME